MKRNGLFSLGAVSSLASLVISVNAAAALVVSDGSDGAWAGGGQLALDADGIFHFTTITVSAGQTLSFGLNGGNTPVVLAATGDVVIDGTINVSGHTYTPGPGGGYGGETGATAGTAGQGDAPGGGGGYGGAGGGGGNATPGLVATSRTYGDKGAAGGAIGFAGLRGGSGGGGGGGSTFFGVPMAGADGGGGGGGILISTPGTITINGTILANGGHGGYAFANVFAHGGPGGGGSGGNILLEGGQIALGSSAVLSAIGGAGGGLSTEPVAFDPYFYSSGANGGLGYVQFMTNDLDISPDTVVSAAVVPLPGALVLAAPAVLGLFTWGRRARRD